MTRKQAAIEALAGRFSAPWEKGDGPPDACITIDGKRISVAVATIKRRTAERFGRSKPRLRFDKVALRFVAGLQAALRETVPDGKTLILTVSAPIHLPSKTAAALEDKIRTCLARRPSKVEVRKTINKNQIRARLLGGGSVQTNKVIGFVHNPDSDPDLLADVARSLLECIGAASNAPPKFPGDRWLLLVNDGGPSHLETYRRVLSQLLVTDDFTKILMVLSDGRVEDLWE